MRPSKSPAPKGSDARLALASALLVIAVASLIPGGARAEPPKEPPRPTVGASYEYPWDAKDIGHPERAWTGRAYVHPEGAADPKKPAPLLVFIHSPPPALPI